MFVWGSVLMCVLSFWNGVDRMCQCFSQDEGGSVFSGIWARGGPLTPCFVIPHLYFISISRPSVKLTWPPLGGVSSFHVSLVSWSPFQARKRDATVSISRGSKVRAGSDWEDCGTLPSGGLRGPLSIYPTVKESLHSWGCVSNYNAEEAVSSDSPIQGPGCMSLLQISHLSIRSLVISPSEVVSYLDML